MSAGGVGCAGCAGSGFFDPWAPVVPITVAPKKITSIEFGMLSGGEMRRLSHIPVINRELYYTNARKPVPFGVLDQRLGTSDKKGTCATCGQKLADCVGHYGFIKLELPVFHIGYFKSIVEVLQRVCKTCARVLLTEEKIWDYLAKMRNPNLETLSRKSLAKKILTECKKTQWCPHCGSANGVIHKIGALKLVHERFKVKNNDEESREFQDSFQEATLHNKDILSFLGRAQEDLNPLKVRELFERIPDADVELLDMDPDNTRPELMVLTHFLVPPVCIRPSIPSDATNGSNEDDLTMKLTEIALINGILKSNMAEKGVPMQTVMENWEHLQLQCAMFINSELPGFPASLRSPGKPQRSLAQRLKGKQGRFRGNLSGKRVDFSGRTVISPDPNLKVYQVAVPELVCKILTYPEKVTDYNIDHLRKCVVNGPDKHPGANYVEFSNGNKRYLKYGNREDISRQLKVGDIVERHLMDDDVVLFNRQPSLHKLSIMCHRVKVLPWRTFRFNECVCTPYNADFDGDEMNLHVPQTEEARAEALTLMSVTRNLITPRNGQPIISATQDFITGSYLLSRKNMFFDRSQFCQLCSYLDVDDRKIDLPPPVILKPVELWTGKQIFRMLIKPNDKTNVLLNFETSSRSYSSKDLHMDPTDGYVCFVNSELISGTLDKKIVGEGSKDSLFYALITTYSPEYAGECMNRLAKLTSRWLMNYGFTIGISDVTPSLKLNVDKESIVKGGYTKCNENIALYNERKLEAQPGCTPDQTLEAVLNRDLSNIRETCGKLCLAELHWRNSAMTMAVCGSKGSNINISQMIACVGQQTVSGSRIPNGFMNRSLPHFGKFSRDPESKGFVKNSFFTGLNATEFFFHTMGGREGLVDTAVKTAETGYMQRRLMKALEDLSVQYDGTVRNSAGGIVQFNYGDDGLDPTSMEAPEGRPSNLVRSMQWVRNTMPCRDESPLLPWQMNDVTIEWMATDSHRDRISDKFASELTDFIAESAESNAKMREDLGLNPERNKPKTSVECEVALKMEEEIDPALRQVLTSNQFTRTQIIKFLDLCLHKYQRATTEPGTAVGALGAQSIGEPGTQMTLKTFHFAGVASMNITLGVPRIKEIINASKKISTPIITAELVSNKDEKAARIVKGRIEKTMLKEIVVHIKIVFAPGQCYVSVKLDLEAINQLQLDVDAETIKNSILSSGIKNLKEKLIRVCSPHKIHVYPPDTQRESMLHSLQSLAIQVRTVIVKGLPTVSRAVINRKSNATLNLLVEGLNLRDVMGTSGVIGTKTKSNHIIEVESTLGIEAARQTIMDEIQYTMKSHSMNIDSRHVMLLADLMTFKGEILGITRFGIAKMKDSVLMLASFEKTTDHLFDAAVHSRKDDIVGVSECIIMGIPIPVGTGLFKLLRQVDTTSTETTTNSTTTSSATTPRPKVYRRDPIFTTKTSFSYV